MAKKSKSRSKSKGRLDYYDPRRMVLPPALMRRIRVRKLGRTAGYTAWIVDGSVIRAEVDIDFAIGGNPARYAYVPENEIWLEWTGDENDVKATFMHEVMEADAMRRGYSYDESHEWASEGESAIRALGDGRGLPHFVPNPGTVRTRDRLLSLPGRVIDDPEGEFPEAFRYAADFEEVARPRDFVWVFLAAVPVSWLRPATRADYEGEVFAAGDDELEDAEESLRKYEESAALFEQGAVPPPILLDARGFVLDGLHRIAALSDIAPGATIRALWAVDARARQNPRTAFLHVLGYDRAGKLFAHDMQSDMDHARYSARRMLTDQLEIVHSEIRTGVSDEYGPEVLEDFWAKVPEVWTAEQAADANDYSFWVSPDGDIYPVDPFRHVETENRLVKYGLVPEHEETMMTGSPALAAGWLQVSQRDDDSVTFNFDHGPTQRQLDAVFDLVRAHKEKGARYPGRRRELFWRGAMEWLSMPTVTRNNPGEPDERYLTVCAYCNGVILDLPPGPHGEVSHGFCPKCLIEHAAEWGFTDEDIAELLEADDE